VTPPKSEKGIRGIPLGMGMCRRLWPLHRGAAELVFTSPRGMHVDRRWLRRQVLDPATKVAGVRGARSTPSGTRVRRSCSRRARAPSRCRSGSATATRPLRCGCTCICSTTASAMPTFSTRRHGQRGNISHGEHGRPALGRGPTDQGLTGRSLDFGWAGRSTCVGHKSALDDPTPTP